MLNFEKPPLPERDGEQTQEKIREILEEALKSESPVDLVILNTSGKPELVPDLLVEEIDKSHAMMTYLDEKGNRCEVIPLELARVKKAEFKK